MKAPVRNVCGFSNSQVLIAKSWAGFHAILEGKCVLFTAPFPENSTCMAAKMEFHPGLDEVREHLHFLSCSINPATDYNQIK